MRIFVFFLFIIYCKIIKWKSCSEEPPKVSGNRFKIKPTYWVAVYTINCRDSDCYLSESLYYPQLPRFENKMGFQLKTVIWFFWSFHSSQLRLVCSVKLMKSFNLHLYVCQLIRRNNCQSIQQQFHERRSQIRQYYLLSLDLVLINCYSSVFCIEFPTRLVPLVRLYRCFNLTLALEYIEKVTYSIPWFHCQTILEKVKQKKSMSGNFYKYFPASN